MKVSVIGLGFVGLAMSAICANSKKINHVFGIENNSSKGHNIVNDINKKKKLPISSEDKFLDKTFQINLRKKKITVSTNYNNIFLSDVIIVSVNFDLNYSSKKKYFLEFSNLLDLTNKIGEYIKKNSLILFETTLPTGTSENLILPQLEKSLSKRSMNLNDIYFSYSYERVMPGNNYYNSIKQTPRVYSGLNDKSKKKCEFFLKIILDKNTDLFHLKNIRDCETAKIIENSFRATNIAFVEEWNKFAIKNNLNLNKILECIRVRPTHQNIRYVGLGVGGYCLTKDPLFGILSEKYFKKKSKTKFPIVQNSFKTNNLMVNTSFNLICSNLKKTKKKILILGLTYKNDVSDLRASPSLYLFEKLKKKYNVFYFDPFIKNNDHNNLNDLFIDTYKFEYCIFSVNHSKFSFNLIKKIINFYQIKTFINLSPSLDFKKLENLSNIKYLELGDYSFDW